MGEKPNVIVKTSYLDGAHMNRYGIQTITYGPAGHTTTTSYGWNADMGEHINVRTLVNATRVYALAALDICSRDRDPSVIPEDPHANLPEPGQIELLRG